MRQTLACDDEPPKREVGGLGYGLAELCQAPSEAHDQPTDFRRA